MKSTLAKLRLMGMENASKKLGIDRHPEVVKIELDLKRSLTAATHAERVSDVN